MTRLAALLDPRRIGLSLAAPVLALLVSLALSSVALLVINVDPLATLSTMLSFGTTPVSLANAVNRAVPYYLSGIAVAVGFRMGLFNIGVEGQYRIAALVAAAAGAAVALPGVLNIVFVIIVAMVVGAAWAGLAGLLKATRGVSEVISTIMLNYVATSVAAYLLATYLAQKVEGSNNLQTAPLPASSMVGPVNSPLGAIGLSLPAAAQVGGLVVLAVVVGIVYHVMLTRTRFGFELQATGISPSAARASGVDSKRMIVVTMCLSGALAGLVGLPALLGDSGSYGLAFPAGYGFTGIAVALLGRNNAVGIALGALLFGFLDRSSQILDLQQPPVPKEIVTIMQGAILLSVVVAYELVRRLRISQAERQVRAQQVTA